MLSYKCNISIALWSRAENAPLTINRKTDFLVLLRSWVWWMDSTPLFCLLYPRTRTKRVGNLDCKPINFSAKVRYNHVTETDRAREGAGAAAGRTLKIEYAASGTSRQWYFRNSRPGHKEDGVAERPMEWCKSNAWMFPFLRGCRGQIKRNHTKPFPNAVRG